jgi:WD40 repeat protein
MPHFMLPVLAFVVIGADQRLTPSVRLDCDGETWPAALTFDGESLLGVLKHDDYCDVVVWDTNSKSRTTLAKGGVGFPIAVSPDRRNVAGMVLGDIADAAADGEVVVWDVASRTTTAARLKLKKTGLPPPAWPAFPCQSADFSCDSTLFALADGDTKKAHIWKREASGAWIALKTLDVAQRVDTPKPSHLEIKFSRDGSQLFVFFLIGAPDKPLSSVATERWDIASGRPADCRIPTAETFVSYTGPFPHVLGEKTTCFQAPEGSGRGAIGVEICSGKEKYDVDASTLWARLSPDGRICGHLDWLLMSAQPLRPVTVGFWNFDDGTQRHTVELPKSDQPPIAAFTPDSRCFLCTAGPGGRSVFVTNVRTGEILSSWTGSAPVRGLFPVGTGEVAVIAVEPKAVLISMIRVP